MPLKIDRRDWLRFKRRFLSWGLHGVEKDVDRGVGKYTKGFKRDLNNGIGGDGKKLSSVSSSTMNQPIRRGGPDRRKRGSVNPSSGRPLNATGKSIDKIKYRIAGKRKWEVLPGDAKSEMIFVTNAYPKKGSRKGYTVPPKRDPFVTGEKGIDLIELEVLKGLDKILAGI